tara:strand:- start:230 stop:508 length:279 start_codon:yes stop_codon:yes gene_type:complete
MIIISKIELEGTDNLKYTDIGYTDDINVANEINENYDLTLGLFLAENRTRLITGDASLSTFFIDTEYVIEARTIVDSVEAITLLQITNINEI